MQNQQNTIMSDFQKHALYKNEEEYFMNAEKVLYVQNYIKNKKESEDKDSLTENLSTCLKVIEKYEKSILNLFKRIKELYLTVFPDLFEIVTDQVKICKIILKIGNFDNIENLNFSSVIDRTQTFNLMIALNGKSFSTKTEQEKEEVFKTADLLIKFKNCCNDILSFVGLNIKILLPNVVSIVGERLAAELLSRTESVKALSLTPACNIQVMGSQNIQLNGRSKAGKNLNLGLFQELEIVQKMNGKSKTKIVKLIANGVSKASKIDASGFKKDGEIGKKIYKDILQKFDKYLNPPKGQQKQPLPIPDSKPKKRRGGKKFRRMKEQLELTEVRKLKNRTNFGTDFTEDVGNELGTDVGLLGQKNSGRLRYKVKKTKTNLTKKQKKRLNININKGNLDGLKSSIALTDPQGIILANPNANRNVQRSGKNSIFGHVGFKSVLTRKNK